MGGNKSSKNLHFFVDSKYHFVVFTVKSFSAWNQKISEALLDSKEFFNLRKELNKTQKQTAQLLGTSIKAVHSYEQGWRNVPAHIERQLFFLVSKMRGRNKPQKSCWVMKKCPPGCKKKCPAWEFRAGKLCWFINGTICEGTPQNDWSEKIRVCRFCEVFSSLIQGLAGD